MSASAREPAARSAEQPAANADDLRGSWLARARRYVNQGGSVRQRIEFALAVVMSVAVLAAGARTWRPRHDAPIQAATSEPVRCDAETVGSKVEAALHVIDVGNNGTASTRAVAMLEPLRTCVEDDSAYPNRRGEWLVQAAERAQYGTARWFLGTGHINATYLNQAMGFADPSPETVSLLRAAGAEELPLAKAARLHALNSLERALDQQEYSRAALTGALLAILQSHSGHMSRTREVEGSLAQRDHAAKELQILHALLLKGARVDGDALVEVVDRVELRDALLDLALANRESGAVESAIGRFGNDTPAALVRKIAALGVDWGYHDGEDDAAMPLVRAVAAGNEPLVQILLELGAPVNRFYKDGSSALQAALACTDFEPCGRLTEVLLAHGADANRRFPDGTTPLFTAAETGNGRAIRALIDKGARLEERVVRETPFEAAERSGNTPAMRILAARGAHVGAPRP